ncbi:hypothetical protein ACFV0C_37045 [Streptomyces sp. NPDC059568]|uniref:hypothetical protein n=1 Tax=Streptomyces sp. NPDC059568 TaxID=3346868 RepID=UPI003697D321
MQKQTLARHRRLDGAGWTHPYAAGPFDPWLYADGGDGDDSGSDSGDDGDGSTDDAGNDDAGGTGDNDTTSDDAAKDEKPKPKAPAKKGNEAPDAKIARLEKELKAANAESAKARTTAKKAAADEARTEIVQELGKALGLIKDDDKDAAPPDPAALTAKIEQATAAHRETAIELAVYRGAAKHRADPDALTDSRAFLASIKGLDPSDEGFNKAVSAAIKKAVEDNPKLKVGGTAPDRAAGDFNGGTGDGDGSDPTDIDEIRKARRKRRTG